MMNPHSHDSAPAGEISSSRSTAPDQHLAPTASRWAALGGTLQFLIALGLTIAALGYLIFAPAPHRNETQASAVRPPAEAVTPELIRIEKGSSIDSKLEVVKVQRASITAPLLSVPGTILASLRPGKPGEGTFWQFDSPEVLTDYTEWQKSIADIKFTESQLKSVNELAETRIKSQTQVVERLKKLVDAGTDTLKDLAAEQAALIEFQIQGQKEIYEADTAVQTAKRREASLTRQLQQAGLEPSLLQQSTSDMDIVMANVPEAALSRVKVGQKCEARFFGLENELFQGTVQSIAPVISRERRTLRVLFVIDDPHDLLRPGMYGDIGLGTDPREALLMPAYGLIHVGNSDFALVRQDPEHWRITEVQVGEPHNDMVEVISGVKDGEQVIGHGAILLKPFVVNSVLTRNINRVAASVNPRR